MDERRQARQPSQRNAAKTPLEDPRTRYEDARRRLIEIGAEVGSSPSPLADNATKPSHELFRREERARAEAIRAMIEGGNPHVAELLVPPDPTKKP